MLLEVFQMPHQREKMWSSLLRNDVLHDYSEFINSAQGMIKQLNSKQCQLPVVLITDIKYW